LILFVDDELHFVRSYIEELELSGFGVQFCASVDSALEYLAANRGEVKLCIIDIMMPPGTAFAGIDTQSGLMTGNLLYDRIRQEVPGVPLVVLTNRISEEVERKAASHNGCWLFHKDQCFPFELANHVRNILSV
jgi:CheY-like chemotaxis protein